MGFAWNPEGDILTITPDDPLAYAQGNDLNVEALEYTFGVSVEATDLAGNALDFPLDSSFDTARNVILDIDPVSNLSGYATSANFDATNNDYIVGDGPNNELVSLVADLRSRRSPPGHHRVELRDLHGRTGTDRGQPLRAR